MKRILLLSLLLLPIVALAQYPTFSNKQKLGVQTTGDGLIFRGTTINNIPNYTPSNINNAYFHLDTTNNKLYLYNDNFWQLVYPTTQFDTTTLNVYLKISDTTAMLLPYFRDSDTTSLNLINRFALKLNISDTATMLTPYMKKADTISLSNRINLKLNISDTTILSNRITTNANNIITINNKLATKLDTIYTKFKNVVKMIENKDTINIGSSLTDGYAINIVGDSVNVDSIILDARYPDRDTTNELQDITFATTAGIVTISGGKVINLDTLYNSVIDSVNLLIRDSIAAFTPLTEGYGINIIGDSINVDTSIIFTQSDTITLSNRINNKLNISDTVSLSNRIDLKLNKTDTINLSNRIDLKLNKSDTISLSNRINIKLNASDTVSLSNRINKKLDTLYVNYPTYIDTITNKDTIQIAPSLVLTEGFGINVIGDSINIDSAVILATQQKQIAYVKNQSGVTMYKGQAVYSSGSSGDNKLVTLASSATEQTSSKTFGIVETDSIPNGGHGYIITFGLLSGFNTDNLTQGSSVYLSNTPGQLTTTKPIAPLHMVVIGVCIRKQQNNGSIFVKIQNGFEFDELHDVRLTDLVDKSSIYYNLSEKLWRDTTAALLVSDTASMLSKYVNTYSNQTGINGDKTFNNNLNILSYNLGTFTSEKSFNVTFNNDANQKVRLYFPSGSRLQGGYEITLSSGFYFTQASGMLRKTYGVQLQESGQLYVQSTNVPYVLGAIGNHFTISDFEYDSQTNTWGVIIACLNSNASNLVHINIKSYINPENLSTWLNARASAANITNIYTTNTTVYPNLNPTYLSKSDTASMLLPYVNTYNNQLNINGNKTFNNVVTIDSATVTGKLLVNTNISDAVKISSNTNSTNLELMNSSGTVSIKSSNKNMILQTDTTALVYLNGDNKKVGILTMNPQQELEVAGNVRIDSLNNNIVPTRMVGSDNNGDLTNVNLGEGLSFVNDTLKVDLTIIDTAIAASSITLAGHVTGTGSTNSTVNTTISNNVVTNDMLAGGISDTKLNTITTAGKVDNSATTATSSLLNNTIVLRNGSGDFTARNITATNFYGLASTATLANTIQSSNTTGIIKLTTSSNSVLPIITVPDVNATMATTNLSQTFGGTQTFSNTISGSINGNAATVTSVLPSNFASQTANTVLAAPNGSSGTPTFRSLVSSDIPSLNYLPLTGGTLSINSSTNFLNTANDNANLTLYNSSSNGTNTIYNGLKFFVGAAGGAIAGGEGQANIYAIRRGSNLPGTDLSFILKGAGVNENEMLERLRLKYDGKVGIGTSTPSYLLDVNGQIGSTGFVKSGGLSTEFLKANGTVDNNTYLTTSSAASTYLPLTGGTLTGNLYGTNQSLSSNLTISDIIPGNSAPLFTTITTGPSSSETVRFGLNQSLSGGANMFMGGTQGLGGNPTNPNIFFTDSRKAYASIGGIHTSGGTNNQSGHIVFSTTPSVNSIPLTERMRIAQDGAITMSGTLGVTSNITANSFIKSGGTFNQFLKADGTVDGNDYLTTSSAASIYYPKIGGTISGTINRQEGSHNGSANTFYYNILNYFAKQDNIKYNPTAQITFTDRPGTLTFENVVRTSDIHLMTARSFNGISLGQYLDTTLSVVANQDGGRIGISKLNPSYKLDVNGTLGVSGTTVLSSLSGTGTRMVVANNTGVLSTQEIPSSVEPNLYLPLNGPTIVLATSMGSQSTYFLHIDNVSTVTVTLPTASLNTNKSITIKNGGSGQVLSNSSNVQRLTGPTQDIILSSGGGKWATLVSDGFNWITMAAN